MNQRRIPLLPAAFPFSTRRRKRLILTAAIAPAGILLATLVGQFVLADAIFVPSDLILGGREDVGTSQFLIGVTGTTAGANNWPAAEAPLHVIDGVGSKYLNFGITYTGFLVNPAFNGGNGTVVTSMQVWTANDAETRDPSSYELWGTNEALNFSSTSFNLSSFTQISTGLLTLPTNRQGAGALVNTNSQTVTFNNVNGYKEYLIVFPTIKNTPAAANSMQVGEVQLFGTGAFTNLTWTGSSSNIWNINTTTNWANGASASAYNDGNGVIFNDTGLPARTSITISAGGAGVKPAAVLFQNNTLNYTISGESIVSVGGLTLNGTGTVTLNNSNSYATGITVNAGTLNVGATGALGTGALAVNNPNAAAGTGVAVNFASAQVIGSLSGTIGAPASGVNTATINLNGNLTITQNLGGTYSGVIAGTGGLTKEGSAALTLTSTNSYSGTTTVNAGILRSSAPGDNPQGALPAGKPVIVNAGATLSFGTDDGAGYYAGSVSGITVNNGTVLAAAATHSTLPNVVLNGGTISAAGAGGFFNGGPINFILDGDLATVAGTALSKVNASTLLLRKDPQNTGTSNPVTFSIPRGSAAVDLSITSVISDLGAGLIKAGSGILSLSNANTYTGPTVVNGGTLAVTNSGALGTGNVSLNGGVLSLAVPAMLNGFSNFTLNNGATIDASSSVLTLTDNAINEARSAFSSSQVSIATPFVASFVYTASGNRAADGFTFTVQNSAPTAVGGAGGGLGYTGIGNSAAVEFNLYTAGAAPQPVGTRYGVGVTGGYIASAPVNLASGDPIAVTLSYDPTVQSLTETLLDQVTLATYSNTFTGVDFAGAIGGQNGYVGFTGATGGAVATQTIGSFSFDNFPVGVSIGNSVSVAGGATGGLEVLPISATVTGTAFIQGAVSLGASSILNVTGGATASNQPYVLTLGGTTTLAGSVTVNVANNGTGVGSVVASGAIGQGVASILNKTGPGSFTIAAAATYTGATNVNAGTLVVNGSISGATTTVNTTGTLSGTGTLTGVIVASGGTLAPGNGIGTINTGPLSLQSGATYRMEIGATSADQVKVAGAGTLAGTIILSLALIADPTDGTTFTLLDGSSPLIGYSGGARFSYLGVNLAQGQQFTVANNGFTQSFVISYTADSSRDVTLLAVPEPGTGASLLAGMGAILTLRRRRRSFS